MSDPKYDRAEISAIVLTAMNDAWSDSEEYSELPGVTADLLMTSDWLAEHDARLIEELADDMEGGFNRETLNLERRQIKRWLRERARQVREGQ